MDIRNITVTGSNNTVYVDNRQWVDQGRDYRPVYRPPAYYRPSPPVPVTRKQLCIFLMFPAIGLIYLVAVLAWQWLLGAVVIAGVASAVYVVLKDFRDEDREIAARKRALAARADAQHQAILKGDERTGTYGAYPPAATSDILWPQ